MSLFDGVFYHFFDLFILAGSETRLPGKVMIFSGQDGATIQDLMVPDGRESYFSPVLYSRAVSIIFSMIRYFPRVMYSLAVSVKGLLLCPIFLLTS